MNTIIFKKNASEPDHPVATEWTKEKSGAMHSAVFENGTITVVRKSDYQDFLSFIEQAEVLNCGIKAEKVELYRALRFHRQTERNSPRRLIAGFGSLSAFRRSFFRFWRRHYKASDPSCFLFVPDERLDELAALSKKPAGKPVAGDPYSLLLSSIPTGKTMDEISKVYIGESINIQLTRAFIYKASRSVSPVLILGESGTGKELIAREIFNHSTRNTNRFVTVNCSAIPDTLLESELFGHLRGSFTDARSDREGLFVAAHKGTLFLDEIGDLSLANQAKVLRAIYDLEVMPLGANTPVKVDVRIIAATNRNLASMMKQKTFREDLYYRINSIIIFAPPLRENPEDIPRIASALWKKLDKPGRLSNDFLSYLKTYSWPGNVRELKTLLNTLTDLFEGVTPERAHVEAMRAYHRKILSESASEGEDDFTRMLKSQCKNRIIEVHNMLRGIKIEMRPVINRQHKQMEGDKLSKLRSFIIRETNKLENLCREPIYFKNRILFDRIKRFRYILEKTAGRWPESPDELGELWHTDLNPLYEQIDREIFEMIWGKVDY